MFTAFPTNRQFELRSYGHIGRFLYRTENGNLVASSKYSYVFLLDGSLEMRNDSSNYITTFSHLTHSPTVRTVQCLQQEQEQQDLLGFSFHYFVHNQKNIRFYLSVSRKPYELVSKEGAALYPGQSVVTPLLGIPGRISTRRNSMGASSSVDVATVVVQGRKLCYPVHLLAKVCV